MPSVEWGRWQVRSLAGTQRVAASFARVLKAGDVVGLTGELGAGKTEFVRLTCSVLGLREVVSSPSFVRLNKYEMPPGGPFEAVYHADFYLAKSLEDALDYGLDELYTGRNLVFVEWAERFPQLMPRGAWRVELAVSGPKSREIVILQD
ncbi:MAG: tRNA (adenosine(37)-N6)-threonylcarbamoyltransferase complex ATPase subunit type 1 TsaE [Calditrichaeota bacterium]|nr:tRNA (adenosine(37)-N6)-threonylcarbamoyltransferase complex ATPase subunit type 1 TsaE [Calditrichota bacterium]